MTEVKSVLSGSARKVTGEALQGAVIDLIDLSLLAKQAHWNLVGKHFRPLHLQLDEVVDGAREHTDTCAERAAAIGVSPDGRPETVARHLASPRLGPGYVEDDKAVEVFTDILAAVSERFRQRIDETAQADPVTENLFEEISHDLEKHLWMLQVQR
ncbi:MAG: Dps family protein [Carbonactinosporaceae bacterium]